MKRSAELSADFDSLVEQTKIKVIFAGQQNRFWRAKHFVAPVYTSHYWFVRIKNVFAILCRTNVMNMYVVQKWPSNVFVGCKKKLTESLKNALGTEINFANR